MLNGLVRDRIILVDWSIIVHRAAYALKNMEFKQSYKKLLLRMLFGYLKRIGLRESDTVVIVLDGKKNWRKEVDVQYKSTRDIARKLSGIDWADIFKQSDEVVNNLYDSTAFHVVVGHTLEADDIISAGVRYFKDKDVVVVSCDSDFDQLFAFDNFSYFSVHTKRFKDPIKNPYKTLEKKIKIERADDLTSPITNIQEYNVRKKIVNLIKLPDEIEKKCKKALDKIQDKCYNIDQLHYGDEKIKKSFLGIYECHKTVAKTKSKKVNQTKLF